MSENVTGSVLRDLWTGAVQTLRSYWMGPLSSRDPSVAGLFGAGPTSTGVNVTAESALNSSAFWSAVSTVAGDVASVPLELIKRDKDGTNEPYIDSKLYELVHDNPNPEMTSMVYREAKQAHVLTWGNGYSEIARNGAGRPVALWPLTPDRTLPFRQDRRVKYRVLNGTQNDTILEASDVLHIPGLGFDGLIGYSVIEKARDSISMGLAIQRFGGSFFGNGATFGGVLSHPQNLTKEVKQGIRESIDAVHGGVDRAHKFVILGGGMTYAKLGIPPNDAQFLESRRFEIEEMARWFHMPQHKLNGLDHATFSNIEHLDLEYYKGCLRGWYVRWEQELNRKLISPLERKSQYFRHNVEGFLRGDSASRAEFNAKMFNIGVYSINMILEKENMNGIGKDGDAHFVPANMMPVELALNPPKPPPLPTVTDVTPPADPKALPPKRDEDLEVEIRSRLAAIAGNTEALKVSLAAAQTAESEAERAQHTAAVEALTATSTRLQQQLDEALARAAAEVLQAHAETAEERTAREAADVIANEALDQHAEASRHVLEATTAKDQAEAARQAAEVIAAEALVRATAERDAAAEDRTAWRVAVDETEAVRLERDRVTAERDEALASAAALQHVDGVRQAAEAKLVEAEQRVATEAASRIEAETAGAAQKAKELQRLTAVLGAHRALIVDAMQRLIRKETDRARKHQGSPEKLRAWVEAFYQTHDDYACDALVPAIRVHLAWQQSTDDPIAVTQALVKAHIAASVAQLKAVSQLDPEDFPSRFERMLQRWETDRPEALADQILKEEVEHVRSF